MDPEGLVCPECGEIAYPEAGMCPQCGAARPDNPGEEFPVQDEFLQATDEYLDYLG